MKKKNNDAIALKVCILVIFIIIGYFFSKIMNEENIEMLQNSSSSTQGGYLMIITIMFSFVITIIISLFSYKLSNKQKERRELIKTTGKKMKLEFVDIMICNKKRLNLSTNPLIYYWIFKDENNNYILMDQYTEKYNLVVQGQYLIPNYTGVHVRDHVRNVIFPGTKMDVYLNETQEDNRCVFYQAGSPEDNTLEINQTVYYENNLVERPFGTYKCRFNHNNVNFETLNNAKYYEGIIEYNRIN